MNTTTKDDATSGISLVMPIAVEVPKELQPLYLSGFVQYTLPPPRQLFQILGSDSQIVEIQLPPGQTVIAEPGTMSHMQQGLDRHVASGGCAKCCTRCCCAGESAFRVFYTNNTRAPIALGLTPNFPAKIIPIDLGQFNGLTIASQKFMAAISNDVEIQIRGSGSCLMGCCGGHGFFLNSLHGSGIAFLNASGTILMKKLAVGEILLVDSSSLVAFESTVQYNIKRNAGCLNCLCGGEGMYNEMVTGPGLVIIQSMSFEKIATAIRSAAPPQN